MNDAVTGAGDDIGRYLLFLWALVATVASTLGNITVLVASLKYDAIDVDRVSKVTILPDVRMLKI